MAAKENFSQLTDRVSWAQARIRAAASKNRAELQAEVEQAHSSGGRKADEIKARAAQGKHDAVTGWQAMKDKRRSHVSDLDGKAANKKAEPDLRRAEIMAEVAENYADEAISFAIAAVQDAGYAVLDAAPARNDADTLASIKVVTLCGARSC